MERSEQEGLELDPNSYNKNFAILQRNAEKLRADDGDPDIDALIPIVEESAAAFKICKARVKAVNEALAEHLKENESAD